MAPESANTERPIVFGIGEMHPSVATALAETFELHRDIELGLATAIARYGAESRAIITRGRNRIDSALMSRFPRLELIANFGVGYDSIDIPAATARGVTVTNTPNVLDGEMGDFTLALLLATVRRLPQADRYLRDGRWKQHQDFPLSASLRERTIGIAGLGRIGKIVARRLEGFDLPISYFGRHPQPEARYRFYGDLRELARNVDTLIVTLPGGSDTQKVINREVLEALGPQGIFINVARGSVVDQPALIDALRSQTILAAGLDVYPNEPNVPDELVACDNAVLLPHIGTATHVTRQRMGELLVSNVVSWFTRGVAVTPVNAITAR
jgi:lactate dehydrogenase-like 2-hydroxyacid dehydrogenase